MRSATEVFGQWLEEGKDIGMQNGHAIPVQNMIDFALKERSDIGDNFSFLDLGCGNGWVVRDIAKNTLCNKAVGIDGAEQMIKAAVLRGGDEEYFTADINSFDSPIKYDLIHSMEVLYYLKNPADVVSNIAKSWLNDNGRFIAGIDLYHENVDSHSWQGKVGTPMLMLKESEWIDIFKASGLKNVTSWRANQNRDWPGTLVLTGTK